MADQILVRLKGLLLRGENQEVEFKEREPDRFESLAKEIAAFATSNDGTILIGVRDDGTVAGLPQLDSPEKRDQVIRKLENACRDLIKPRVTPKAEWIQFEGHTLLALHVRKGVDPVYYWRGQPMLRHVTSSLTAEPQEVINRVKQYLDGLTSGSSLDPLTELRIDLARKMAVLLMWSDSPERELFMKPWSQEWRLTASHVADELREALATDVAQELTPRELEPIKKLLTTLDELANVFRTLHMQSGPDLKRCAADIRSSSSEARGLLIGLIPDDPERAVRGRSELKKASRRLSALAGRIEELVESGRTSEAKDKAGEIGFMLSHLVYDPDALVEEPLRTQVAEVGLEMRLIELVQLKSDGGRSMRKIVEGTQDQARRLEAMVVGL